LHARPAASGRVASQARGAKLFLGVTQSVARSYISCRAMSGRGPARLGEGPRRLSGVCGHQLGWQVEETSRLVCRHGGFNVRQ
jgi:hypothetical protein